MTTLQASSPTQDTKSTKENMLLAENEQLRQKCAQLEQQVKLFEPDTKVKFYEPDTEVIDGLCDICANDTEDFDIDGKFMFDWGEMPRPTSPFGGSSFGDFQRSSSLSLYFGTFDGGVFHDDASSLPAFYENYGDNLFESISPPRPGRSLSSSWQSNVGTPRLTDENQKANANVVFSPSANVTVKMEPRDIGAHGETSLASPKIPMVSRAFLSRLESPRAKCRKISPEEGSNEHSPQHRELQLTPFLREEKVVPSPVQPGTSAFREAKEGKWWDVVLSPEQRRKHENWVYKKRSRVKYGTAYVYKNKREIAKARTRSDGKFQKTGCEFYTLSPPTKTVALSKRKRC